MRRSLGPSELAPPGACFKGAVQETLHCYCWMNVKGLFLGAAGLFPSKFFQSKRNKITQNKINFVKNCPQWGLNSHPPDHHSNALATELGRNLLGRRFLK